MTTKHEIIKAYNISIQDVRDYYESIKDSLYQRAFDYLYERWAWVENGKTVVLTESIENECMFGINKTKSTLLRLLRDERLPSQDVLKIVAFFESGKVKKIR